MKMQIVSQAVRAGRKYVQENPEKVQQLAHSAGGFINKRTHGKYADKIAKAEAAADEYVAKQRPTNNPAPYRDSSMR